MSLYKYVALFTFAMPLSGCGLFVPEKEEFFQSQKNVKLYENTLVANIKCELTKGLHDVLYSQRGGIHNDVSWLLGWGATVNLKLTVDEKSALTPGASFTRPYNNVIETFATGSSSTVPQSFAFGIGPTGSVDATRIETIAFTYEFKNLDAEYNRSPVPSCAENERGVMIDSDLKIGQFLEDKIFIASDPGSTEPKENAGPYTVFSYEATFVGTYGANLTPTWKFARVSANPNSPFFMASRQKTDDLQITLGKIAVPAKGETVAKLSQEAQDVHLAHLIGQATATAIQSQQP
jgi:hypothetical protein